MDIPTFKQLTEIEPIIKQELLEAGKLWYKCEQALALWMVQFNMRQPTEQEKVEFQNSFGFVFEDGYCERIWTDYKDKNNNYVLLHELLQSKKKRRNFDNTRIRELLAENKNI